MSDVPLEHLDFQYVRDCKNGNELEKILKVLRYGKEGHYPELIEATEKRLKEIKPKSKLLIKARSAVKSSELSLEEESQLKNNLAEWQEKMSEKKDHVMSRKTDDDLPPVRSGQVSMKKQSDASSKSDGAKATRIKSSDYKSWDKFDPDKELSATETTTTPPSQSTQIPRLLTEKELLRCSTLEKEDRAIKEKEKGNEAFHAGDLEEAIVYYSRSLQLMPSGIAYNNRAVAEIRLEKYQEAVEDCTAVLKMEPENVKAMMRRAIARHKLKQLEETKEDLEALLKLQRTHKKAKELYEQVQKELAKQAKSAKTKSTAAATKRRLKIEEVIEPTGNTKPAPSPSNKPSASCDSVHDTKTLGSRDVKPSGSYDVKPSGSHDVKPSGSHNVKPSGSHDVKTSGSPKTGSHDVKPSGSDDVKPSRSHDVKPSGSHDALMSDQKTVVIPLPVHVVKLKEQGNKLFQAGQYGEALDCYSNAINGVQKKGLKYSNSEVAVLFSNRAACHLKIGDCRGCVTDCSTAISMAPANSYKPLLRRALAYETTEKYQLALVDYQLVAHLNSSNEQARIGCTRLVKLLRDEMGPDWRTKLPVPADHKAVMMAQFSHVTPTPSTTTVPAELTEEQRLEKYEELKESGNAHVKKGQYLDAASCYTKCIQLCPGNPVAYSNRALCHLKLNSPTSACDDCTIALKLSPKNVKALFRRALAMKECGQLLVAMDDLTAVLTIEPGNKAAQKELKVVRELNETNEKLSKKEGNKKRVPIIVDNENPSPREPLSDKEDVPTSSSYVDVDVTLTKVTPYEFMQKWNCVPKSAGSGPHAALLKQVPPQQLPTLLSNKLDGSMLPDILLAIKEHLLTADQVTLAGQMMKQLTTVDRFSIAVKFLSRSHAEVVKDIFSYLEEKSCDTELSKLRKLYGV